jgi:thiamine pyrophosphokinase
MSSHHFVKENQEPALIIANGEECSAELMGQLLEWQPTVMVLDGALDRVLQLGIRFDIVLGDFDREHNPEEKLANHHPVKIVHTPDQDKTDLEKGLDYLIDSGCPAVNIIWATGKRADHTIANITNIVKYKNLINIVMWDNYSKIFPINSSFEKKYLKGTPLSLIPVGFAGGIITQGLLYNLNDENLEIGARIGSSNEASSDGIVKITYKTGNLLLMECKD